MISKVIKYILLFFLLLYLLITLELKGYIYHNDLLAFRYSIHGIDISHHNARINWENISNKKYKFALIKATEGKDFYDRDFLYNFSAARKANLYVGAYHFFSMLSDPEDQAYFYIYRVKNEENLLPPIIDFEIPTTYDKKDVVQRLKKLISILERYYKKRAIIYVTKSTYKKYIKDDFLDNYLWVRDIKFYPLGYDRWVLWQYSNRGRLNNEKGFIDKNVFRYDSIEEFIENSKLK